MESPLVQERKLVSERVKLEKATLKTKQFEKKQEKKTKGRISRLVKVLGTRGKKAAIKKPKITLRMEHKEIPSTWEDPNRFFKGKYEEDKRNFFFT